MERVAYLEQRERSISPKIIPDYTDTFDDASLRGQRAICVDRIFRLGTLSYALDTTCFSAVRLFDRCMGMMRAPIVKTNMLVLAIGYLI